MELLTHIGAGFEAAMRGEAPPLPDEKFDEDH